jgi:hypothetical protein
MTKNPVNVYLPEIKKFFFLSLSSPSIEKKSYLIFSPKFGFFFFNRIKEGRQFFLPVIHTSRQHKNQDVALEIIHANEKNN